MIGTSVMKKLKPFNSFCVSGPFLYPLKTSESQRFSDVLTLKSNEKESLV